MSSIYPPHRTFPALGMASLVLGVIALVLSLLPILGFPVCVCGLVLGAVGVAAALVLRNTSLRWSLAGLAVGSLALIANLALNYAPKTEQLGRGIPRPWPTVPDRPFVAPPAQGEMDY